MRQTHRWAISLVNSGIDELSDWQVKQMKLKDNTTISSCKKKNSARKSVDAVVHLLHPIKSK